MSLENDPIVNVIYDGIKSPIELCINNNAERAALILMYASIDALARLGLPADRDNSTRDDYSLWCEKYLVFNSKHKIRGLEWYAARCGFLHNYMAESNLSDGGHVRIISYYGNETGEDIIYQTQEDPDMVIVKLDRLIEVFFSGLDRFVIDIYANIAHEVIEKRFSKMFHMFNY